jgi:hypothetical protein
LLIHNMTVEYSKGLKIEPQNHVLVCFFCAATSQLHVVVEQPECQFFDDGKALPGTYRCREMHRNKTRLGKRYIQECV